MKACEYINEIPLDVPHQEAIYEHLLTYYQDADAAQDRRQVHALWKDFTLWCRERGFTQKDIDNAKKRYRNDPRFKRDTIHE